MSLEKVFQKNNFCRICMDSPNHSLNLFQSTNCKDIVSKIFFCTGVQVLKDDCLPDKICLDCLHLLESAYAFKSLALQSEKLCKDILYGCKFDIKKHKFGDSEFSQLHEVSPSTFDVKPFDVNIEFANFSKIEEVSIKSEDVSNSSNTYLKIEDCENSYDDYEYTCGSPVTNSIDKVDQYQENARVKKSNKKIKDGGLYQCTQEKKKIKEEHQDSNEYVVCEKCGDTVKLRLLDKHNARHGPPVTCTICGYRTTDQYCFQRHLKDRHVNMALEPKTMSECNICLKKFRTARLLKRHKDEVHEKKNKKNVRSGSTDKAESLVCEECNVTFKSRNSLHGHRFRKHKRKMDAVQFCEICGELVPNGLYPTHRLRHFPKAYCCHDCGRSYHLKSDLRQHITVIHLGKSKYMCTVCGQPQRGKYHLLVHTQTKHSDSADYVCYLCGSKQKTKHNLRVHIARRHLGESKCFCCNICEYTNRRRYRIDEHMFKDHRIVTKGTKNPEQLTIINNYLPKDVKEKLEADIEKAEKLVQSKLNSRKKLDQSCDNDSRNIDDLKINNFNRKNSIGLQNDISKNSTQSYKDTSTKESYKLHRSDSSLIGQKQISNMQDKIMIGSQIPVEPNSSQVQDMGLGNSVVASTPIFDAFKAEIEDEFYKKSLNALATFK